MQLPLQIEPAREHVPHVEFATARQQQRLDFVLDEDPSHAFVVRERSALLQHTFGCSGHLPM